MPFHITLRRTFCASHQIRLGDGSLEPLHGHNWHVRLTVARRDGGLDDIGTVCDFHEVERRLADVTGPLHNAHLNDAPGFGSLSPTAEHVALHIGRSLALEPALRVVEVEVTEAEGCSAAWRPEGAP